MDHSQHGRRGGHFRGRGRRGPDQGGRDRQPPPQTEQAPRAERVDVEQIMREIRARISQRGGAELTNQQIQELAARRLEAILDPRSLKPGLLDELRRSAGERPSAPEATAAAPPLFDEVLLYDSPNGLLRLLRRICNPILRLLFNPTPIAHALAVQGRAQTEAAARAAEQERRQAEWNALHYEILQRLVREVARGSLEAEQLARRVESLDAKVDFSDRRVRGLEGSQPRVARQTEVASAPPTQPAVTPPPSPDSDASGTPAAQGQQAPSGDALRRRRRRRRGRRGTGTGPGSPPPTEGAPTGSAEVIGEPEVEEDRSDREAGAEAAFEDVSTPEAAEPPPPVTEPGTPEE